MMLEWNDGSISVYIHDWKIKVFSIFKFVTQNGLYTLILIRFYFLDPHLRCMNLSPCEYINFWCADVNI